MLDKLEQVELRYEKVNELICLPEIVNDQNQYKELMRELKNLTPVVECFRAYKEADKTEKEALAMMPADTDTDFTRKLKFEIPIYEEFLPKQLSENEIKQIVKETMDENNISEISNATKGIPL